MSDVKKTPSTELLALLPLKNTVILPKSIIPIVVGRPISIKAVEYAMSTSRELFIASQKNSEIDVPGPDDIYQRGTKAIILQVGRMPKGALKILVEGLARAESSHVYASQDFLMAECQVLASEELLPERSVEVEALWRHIIALYATYQKYNTKAPADLLLSDNSLEGIETLSDTLAMHLNLSFEDRQKILEMTSLYERLTRLATLLKTEIDILEAEERIRGRVQTQVEKNQREYYLTEQIKAIQKELGRDDQQHEIQQLRATIKTLHLPAEPREKVEKELKRLEQMPALSSEASVSRHYIDWIINLPWHKLSKDTVSLVQAQKILDKKHAGLKKVKERIIEFLAAKKFSSAFERSPIICLVGPPGVGKTSLAASIAESLDREFVRIALGGIRDEAEIRGHRRTYIGALPGKIIQAMRKLKTLNPVILLDEIDKMSSSVHGDPGAALLEVLDPEQNKKFSDHFLEVEYDLSKVMFIATANHLEGIPYPLFDRMELITLSGYTDQEKIAIAENFLIPKNLKEHGLKARQFQLSRELLTKLVSDYTKEAGVRQLDRLIAKLMRKAIEHFLQDPSLKSMVITEAHIKTWIGNQKYKKTPLDASPSRIGLATGLAWTELGGDILEIEVSAVSGKGGVTLTGQLGEVMQESAQAALSYIRSRAEELGLSKMFNVTRDIHVHIPEGATPKDGPSAGITLCVALISALTKSSVLPSVAMTGEITLRGRVISVGGLKEKILAAEQHGIATIILPRDNKDDVEEFMEELKPSTKLVFVDTMDEVVQHAFVNNPLTKKRRMKKGKKTTRGKLHE